MLQHIDARTKLVDKCLWQCADKGPIILMYAWMYSCTCSWDLYQNYIISASLDKEMKLCRHLLVNWCRFRWLISEQRSFNWFVYVDLINVLSAFALFRFSLYRVRSSTRAPFPIFDRLNSNWQTHANNLFYSMSKIWFDFFFPPLSIWQKHFVRFFSVLDDFKLSTMALLRFIHLFVLLVCLCVAFAFFLSFLWRCLFIIFRIWSPFKRKLN